MECFVNGEPPFIQHSLVYWPHTFTNTRLTLSTKMRGCELSYGHSARGYELFISWTWDEYINVR